MSYLRTLDGLTRSTSDRHLRSTVGGQLLSISGHRGKDKIEEYGTRLIKNLNFLIHLAYLRTVTCHLDRYAICDGLSERDCWRFWKL